MAEKSLYPITVYGTTWCGDCNRTRALLKEFNVEYSWVDIDSDSAARSHIQELNNGNRSVPTIIFADGSVLVEPSNKELKQKLEID